MGKLARQKLLAGNNAKSTTMDTTGSATWGWCGVCIGGWVWGGGGKTGDKRQVSPGQKL